MINSTRDFDIFSSFKEEIFLPNNTERVYISEEDSILVEKQNNFIIGHYDDITFGVLVAVQYNNEIIGLSRTGNSRLWQFEFLYNETSKNFLKSNESIHDYQLKATFYGSLETLPVPIKEYRGSRTFSNMYIEPYFAKLELEKK